VLTFLSTPTLSLALLYPRGLCYWLATGHLIGSQERILTSANSVHESVHSYAELHAPEDSLVRQSEYKALVNAYYDLVTLFFEWGWGSSFHFASRYGGGRGGAPTETFSEAIRRHEYQLAAWVLVPAVDAARAAAAPRKALNGNGAGPSAAAGPRPHLLDVGCGIGGPYRNIARFYSGQVHITGITLNEYQVNRGNELNAQQGLGHLCRSVQGDFMKLPFEEACMDGAFAIEATCHAPDRVGCYSEVYRVLKPGSVFACYEWCVTDKYDPADPEHRRIKKDIEVGDGLPDIITTHECLQAMKDAGFEILHERDVSLLEDSSTPSSKVEPWEAPLTASWNPLSQRFQFNRVGGPLTNGAIRVLEWTGIAPAGTSHTQRVLQNAAFALREAGRTGIMTTMYLMVGRKPGAR
jgi:sterol 24-C-methyltransferase